MSEMSYGTAVSRALRLVCPRCGKGRLFKNLIVMYPRCSECSLKYEREPGYFLGSIYINYGFIGLTTMMAYLGLHYGAGYSNEALTPFLVTYVVGGSLFLFRYARSWWLTMDCYCDPIGFGRQRNPSDDSESGNITENHLNAPR